MYLNKFDVHLKWNFDFRNFTSLVFQLEDYTCYILLVR